MVSNVTRRDKYSEWGCDVGMTLLACIGTGGGEVEHTDWGLEYRRMWNAELGMRYVGLVL